LQVSVDDETYRRARVAAAAQARSVSALVREFLQSLTEADSESERLKRRERDVLDRIDGYRFDGSKRLSRDEVNDRTFGRL
jgi:hypothetical protein